MYFNSIVKDAFIDELSKMADGMGPQANAGYQAPSSQPAGFRGTPTPAPTLPSLPVTPAKQQMINTNPPAATTNGGQQASTGSTTMPESAGLIQKALDRGVHVGFSMPIGGNFSPKNYASPDFWSKQVGNAMKPNTVPAINYHAPDTFKGAPPSPQQPSTSLAARGSTHASTAINYTP